MAAVFVKGAAAPILLNMVNRDCNALVDCNRTHKRRILFSVVLVSRTAQSFRISILEPDPSSVQAPTPFISGEPIAGCLSVARVTALAQKKKLGTGL